MAAKLLPWRFLYSSILFFIYIIPLCYSQSTFPQNIETFYPFSFAFSVQTINDTSSSGDVISLPPSPLLSHPDPQPKSKKTIATAAVVVATAVATLLLSLFLIFFIQRFVLAKRREEQEDNSSQSREDQALGNQKIFRRFNGNFNGFILEENGSDVIYWTKSVRRKSKKRLLDRAHNPKNEEDDDDEEEEEEEEEEGFTRERRRKSKRIQETPLLHRRSSTSHLRTAPEMEFTSNSSSGALPWLPPPPVPSENPTKRQPPPPPPPIIPAKNLLSPPLPPKPVGNPGQSSAQDDQVKLKPLHWDKVNTNVDHSMAWDRINGGSFRFNGDLMEALFGYVATNKKSPPKRCNKPTKSSSSNYGGRAQIFILDSRRSQNIAIILKSLTLSRQELLGALMEGQGLDPDILEKLVRIAPNREEQSQILEFDGDPLKLADAESFIFHLLKAFPTAFTRLNAMLFRSNFKSELSRLRDFSQTLELGCDELRKKGLFTKILEATLKAGNRMNAGTTRGNAQAFNLNSLLKLSDVKSTDGKTTLLHFVVEEVIRSEGKKRFSNPNSKNLQSKREREIEYTILGLPVVESLSSELPNVKKASTIDYKAYITTGSQLTAQISEIRELVSNEGGEFKRKMMDFVNSAEEELKTESIEQKKVMEIVKKTNEYFETGDRNRENPLGLFVIVKDFLSMVGQVCREIGQDSRKKSKRLNSDPYPPLKSSVTVKFPCLPEHLMCTSIASQSSDEDF